MLNFWQEVYSQVNEFSPFRFLLLEYSSNVYYMLIMPPTLKNFGVGAGHIASGLSVRSYVRSSHLLVHSITLEPCTLMF